MGNRIPTWEDFVNEKIYLDKYYTPDDTAVYCIQKTYEVIGKENITEIIEPSAGGGAFSRQIPKIIAYDIVPESPGVIKQDFLKLKLRHKEGRLFIGNPPFGDKNRLSVLFFKKCVEMGDFIAFILPISQLNNRQQMYEFDLIHSEDLGKLPYSEKPVHCCFNIYKRNPAGLQHRETFNLKDISIMPYSRGSKGKKPIDFDYGMCGWGNSSIGKEVTEPGTYAQEYFFKIHNKKYKKNIIDLLKNTDWRSAFVYTAAAKLQVWRLYKYLQDAFPQLK